MAEKGFGVKEINLIGASGTPTIESPNNLNLNAVNVAISTNVSIGGTLTVSGNISVGGTLTYEDVTNIDSVGIITARTGVKVLAGGINVVGVSYFNNNIVATATTALSVTAADESSDTSCNVLFSTAATGNVAPKTGSNLTFNSSNGTLTATTFSGSGASLTNLPAANLTGTLPAISGANLTGIAVTEAPVTDYTVTANGSSAYRIHGGGVDETADDPDLYLIRGQKYRFNNTTGSSHPFALRVSSGGSAYTDGVTGSQNGIQFFTVPYDAPASLVYQCTIHSGMVGNIFISGGDGTHKIVADANPVMEFDRGSANNTNLNLKYNGTLTGQLSVANEEVQLSTVGSNTDIAFYIQGAKKGYWKDSGELWFGSNNTYIKANQIRFGEAGAAYIDQYTTGQDINFRTSVSSALDTTGMTLKSTGNLAFASGKGIDFSATGNAGNSASMSSELFDDYEEGSWTPYLVSSAGNMSTTSFSMHQGTYTKIGRLVYITGVMYGPRSSGGTGNLRISNLPYTVRNGDHAQLLTKDYQFSNYPTNFGHISGYGMQNATQIQLFKREGSAQAGLPLSWWSTSANDYMYFNMTYTTDT